MILDDVLDDVLAEEGSKYTDHPADKGGPTRHGITLATLCEWRKNVNLKLEDVANLTEVEARQIYRARYFERPGYAALPDSLWPAIVDAAVNHGPASATRMLQRALGVKDDGVLGPMTLAMVKTYEPRTIEARFVAERARKYGKIITGNPSQAVFASGWCNRLARFIERLA